MNILGTRVNISISWIVLVILGIIWTVFTYLFFGSPAGKWEVFWGGASAGMIALVIDFGLSMYKYAEIDRLRNFGIIEILSERKGVDYYSKLLKTATFKVQVLGTTCSRFINDFSNLNSDQKVLIEALKAKTWKPPSPS